MIEGIPELIIDSERSLLNRLYAGYPQQHRIIKYAVKAPFGGMVLVVHNIDVKEHILIHLNDALEIVKMSTVGLPIDSITNLKAVDDGVICTGTYSSRTFNIRNEFVITRFNTDLEIEYFNQFDTLFTDEDPTVIVDQSGLIIISGIKQLMTDRSIATYLIRLDKDLVMRRSTIYDNNNTVKIAALGVTNDRKIVGVGSVVTTKPFLKQTATVIVFDRNDLSYVYDVAKSNTWIDEKEHTHVKDVVLLKDGSLVCAGLSIDNGDQRATVWRFKDLLDKKSERSIMNDVNLYGEYMTSSVFKRLVLFDDSFVCIGSSYNSNDGQHSLFIARFDMPEFRFGDMIITDELKEDSVFVINNELIRMSS